jgi:hypothetical protein
MEPLGETRVTGEPRRRVSYYFDPDIGTYAYTMQVLSFESLCRFFDVRDAHAESQP